MSNFETAVREEMNNTFNMEELRSLTLELGLDWDNIPGETKRRKAEETVAKMMRLNRANDLIAVLREKRPNGDWPDSPIFTERGSGKTAVDHEKSLQNYLESLRQEVGYVPILGRNQQEPLENVFTHVNVLDKLLAERRYNIDRLQTEAHPRDFAWQDDVERIAGEDAVQRFDKLFILGKPGAGKTTFLKHTALQAINREIDKIPIFITLKALSDSGKPIFDYIVYQFGIHRFADAALFVQDLLQNGKAILLFDGLDEVNLEENKRANLIQALNEFIYQYGTCPILMSCRVAATDYSFTQFNYVEMADFDDQQIGNYIDKWFVDDDLKRERCRQILLESEGHQAIRELAQVPLLLALLCLVYEELNEFPPNHAEIYEEATRALLIRWDASRNIQRGNRYEQMSLKVKQRLLAHLAAQTFEAGVYFMREQHVVRMIETYLQGVAGLEEADGLLVLREIEAKYGILVERAHRVHAFSHLTLQEYFTARYIVDNERRGTLPQLMTHLVDDRWREVFLLVAGMLDDATEFSMLYLQSMQMIASTQLASIFEWIKQKQSKVNVCYKDEAVRLFLLLEPLKMIRAGTLKSDRDKNIFLARLQAKALATEIDQNLDLALILQRDFDLGQNVANNYARGLGSGKLSSVIDYVYETVVQVAAQFELSEFESHLVEFEETRKENVDEQVESWQELKAIIKAYEPLWNPFVQMPVTPEELDDVWDLSEEQSQMLLLYIKVTWLFVRCLKVAYLPNRQAIRSQIMLLAS